MQITGIEPKTNVSYLEPTQDETPKKKRGRQPGNTVVNDLTRSICVELAEKNSGDVLSQQAQKLLIAAITWAKSTDFLRLNKLVANSDEVEKINKLVGLFNSVSGGGLWKFCEIFPTMGIYCMTNRYKADQFQSFINARTPTQLLTDRFAEFEFQLMM